MKNGVGILLLALAISAAAQQKDNRASDSKTSESTTVIRAGSLIDGKSDKPRHDQVIIIRDKELYVCPRD